MPKTCIKSSKNDVCEPSKEQHGFNPYITYDIKDDGDHKEIENHMDSECCEKSEPWMNEDIGMTLLDLFMSFLQLIEKQINQNYRNYYPLKYNKSTEPDGSSLYHVIFKTYDDDKKPSKQLETKVIVTKSGDKQIQYIKGEAENVPVWETGQKVPIKKRETVEKVPINMEFIKFLHKNA